VHESLQREPAVIHWCDGTGAATIAVKTKLNVETNEAVRPKLILLRLIPIIGIKYHQSKKKK